MTLDSNLYMVGAQDIYWPQLFKLLTLADFRSAKDQALRQRGLNNEELQRAKRTVLKNFHL